MDDNNLSSFAFNYDTFVREKVNSHYDFPHELDLWDYSRKGLASAEGKVCCREKGKKKMALSKSEEKGTG